MRTDRFRSRALALAVLTLGLSAPALLTACDAAPGGEAEAVPASPMPPGPARQAQHPVDNLALYLAGVHVMKANIREWWNAYHYCEALRADLIQCAVYDTTAPGAARLNAVEYIVPNDVYQSFPPEEQRYWHPHAYEVDGGLLDVPELPADSARKFLQAARSTWGKTWHLWQSQQGARFPTGEPKLAWSIEGPDSIPPGVRPRGNVLTGRRSPR
ncbi:MAG TPA: DUF1264 domain-containing protein [Longimicrobiales bacterium]